MSFRATSTTRRRTPRRFCRGWFRTGDLGTREADGQLVLTGRVKDLINRGGEKIAPAEVEAALRRHPAVAEAAVFAMPDARLEEAVAAAVVLTARARSTGREIRREAARYLAPHKLPRQVWLVAALPRTPTGKVRRDDLQRQFGGPGAPADAVE